MTSVHPEARSWPELHRARRAIVVVDVVESVRLMRAHEDEVIERWRDIVGEVRSVILPRHAGRLVKSLGDGMLLEFEHAARAMAMAFELQGHAAAMNVGVDPDRRICLRAGLHVAEVVADELDVYGSGVNLTARIATVARPGGVAASQDAVSDLLPGVDALIESAGLCYFKHLDAPVPVFHLTPPTSSGPSPRAPAALERDEQAAGACVAMLPIEVSEKTPELLACAELVGDLLQTRLATVPGLTMISRLSMLQFQARGLDARGILGQTGCNYLLAGRLHGKGGRHVQFLELVDGATQDIVWAGSFALDPLALLSPEEAVTPGIAQQVVDQILRHQMRRVLVAPLPNLGSQTLQFAAIQLMHRQPLGDFKRAREVLEHLVDRHPRAAAPHAWLAKWHVLRVNKGWVDGGASERGRALDHARRALDLNPDSAMSMAMEAFVLCHLDDDLPGARICLQTAVDLDPNESWAWLVRSTVEGLLGNGEASWLSASRARALSPMDPLKHYYDGLAASAAVGAERFADAERLAQLSLSKDARHLPTLRALAIAQVHLGMVDQARATLSRVLEAQPEFNLQRYVGDAPRGAQAMRERWAGALREAGAPEG